MDDHVRSFGLTRLVFAEVPANAVYTSPYPLLQVRRDIRYPGDRNLSSNPGPSERRQA